MLDGNDGMLLDKKWKDEVIALSKHKLLEVIEKLNKEEYLSAEDVREYKDTYKALYYLLSISK